MHGRKLHRTTLILVAVIFITSGTSAVAQETGETNFKQLCAACHTIGKGRLVGPDLLNVHQRRSLEWISKFVKSSQSVIKSGDKYADSLFMAYNQVVMPDQSSLQDDQIKDIVAYIEDKSISPVASIPTDTPLQDVQKGTEGFHFPFSFTNLVLLGFILILTLVIFLLSRINRKLADQLMDYYSSNRAFYKKL